MDFADTTAGGHPGSKERFFVPINFWLVLHRSTGGLWKGEGGWTGARGGVGVVVWWWGRRHVAVDMREEEALLGEAVGEVRAEISKSKGYKKKKRRVSKEDRKKKEGGGVGGGVGVGGGEPRCGVCGEVFGSRSRLFAHLREHPDHAVLKGRR